MVRSSFASSSSARNSRRFTRCLTFSMVLPNTQLFINLKKSFSKSVVALVRSYVFRWMYERIQGACLQDSTRCTRVMTMPNLLYSLRFR